MSQDFKYNYWYSYKRNYPMTWDEIPHRIRLSNGNTKTDKVTFTEEDLKDAGYVFTDIQPNYNDMTHVFNWTGTELIISSIVDEEEK